MDLWHARQISVAGSFASRYFAPRTLAPKSCWSKHIGPNSNAPSSLAPQLPFLARSGGTVVLKITITDLSDEQRWSLAGQLGGPWADELQSSWREARHTGDRRRRIVELIEVTSIDRNGEAVLVEIMSQGVEFIASDVYTKHLLRSLRSELKRTRMKGKQDDGGKH